MEVYNLDRMKGNEGIRDRLLEMYGGLNEVLNLIDDMLYTIRKEGHEENFPQWIGQDLDRLVEGCGTLVNVPEDVASSIREVKP